MTDERVIYIRWSDDGRFIRKWDTKPFDGAEPMYSRSWLLSKERVEAVSEALQRAWYCADDMGLHALPEIEFSDCEREYLARAALSSAIGEPYEFSGWVEVVEDDRA